jgi:hypothetical protein
MVLLSEQQANDILGLAGLSGQVVVDTVKQYNHVYRLLCGDEVFFLKTYTKDWYGDDIAATGGCVAHEASAWAILAANGLATPEIVLALQGCDNPLGRPLIVTRALRGANLVEQLQQTGDLGALLETTGAYLGQMHAITFAFPGYLMNSGPIAPPREDDWQHSIWTAQQWQKNVLAVCQHEWCWRPPTRPRAIRTATVGRTSSSCSRRMGAGASTAWSIWRSHQLVMQGRTWFIS